MTHNHQELLVADSFRVRSHRESGGPEARNLQAHFERFKAAASSALTERAQTPEQRRVSQVLEKFLDDARQQIAAFGEGWPRLELWGVPDAQQSLFAGQQLRLSLRPLPELGESIEARTAGYSAVDHPERKGPNIRRYARLNQELRAEALLTDEIGRVVEGATTSLLWWRDGTLYASRDGGRVASVTEQMLRDFATSRHVPSRRGTEYPSKLGSYEVWAVNALHGIRVVTSIDGVVLPSPDKNRLHKFQEALEAAWQPVRQNRAFR